MHNGINIVEKYSLAAHSSVGMGPVVRAAFVRTEEALFHLLSFLQSQRERYHILGRMSNTLAPTSDDGALYVFTDQLNGICVDACGIHIGAGCRLAEAIRYLAERELYFLPSLSGIPGSVGGALASNAGAYGESISDAVSSCRLYDPKTERVFSLSRDEMDFSYRHSRIREEGWIALSCTLRLDSSCTRAEYEKRRAYAAQSRRLQQPKGKSLGSVFKKHEGISVGQLIDEMGYKGRRIGGVKVSEQHAGFFINDGEGTVEDYRALMQEVSDALEERYGFYPEPEITVL